VQVTRATFIPLLAPVSSDRLEPGTVQEEFCGDLTVVYTSGPAFGRRVVTHADLEQLQLPPRVLRRAALEQLETLAARAQFHGQAPSLMLSFDGFESSLLLATEFWSKLEGSLPGDLVVGVPARDVVIVTGSESTAGLERARRAVDRVFMAGDEFLLSRSLLVRRGGTWEPFDRSAAPASPRPARRPQPGPRHHGAEQPPRQYQEHISWPGERVPVASMQQAGPPMERPRPTARPTLAPAAHLAESAPRSPVGPRRPASGPPMGAPRPRAASDPGPRPADVAPYSSVPYSAMPYSATPYSAVPRSAPAGASGFLQAIPPRRPPAGPSPGPSRSQAKPAYRDDPRPTSAPRPLLGQYPPSSALSAPSSAYPSLPDSAPPSYGREPRRDSYDRAPYEYDRSGPDRASYERPSHERPGYDRPSYDRPGPDRSGPDRSAYEPKVGGPSGFDQYDRGLERAEPVSYERPATQPQYPGSWSYTPSAGPGTGRPGWDAKTGPRARFSR
jgi:hypothetical protein